MRIRNSLHIKKNNLRLILRTLIRNQGITQSEIARMHGVGVSTISQILNPLMYKGIVVRKAYGQSSGGRRPALLTLNTDAALTVCIDLSSHQGNAALIDCGLNIRKSFNFEFLDDKRIALTQLAGVISSLAGEASDHKILGACVAISGVPSPKTGEINSSLMNSLVGLPVSALLSEQLKVKVYVENDANLSAIGEFMLLRENIKNMFYIHMGEGLGGGIIIDGDIFTGDDGYSGEIGRLIYCADKMVTVGEIYERSFTEKDSSIRDEIMKKVILTVISNIRCTLDIRNYVIGGKYATFDESTLKEIEQSVRNIFYGFDVKITKSKNPTKSVLLGCAQFILENEIFRL